MRPINNIFIFSFIRSATGQKKNAPIFAALHLQGTDSGRRFKEGLDGNCWWPKHHDWFFNLVNRVKIGSEKADFFYRTEQEFPLDNDREFLIRTVSKENTKNFRE